MKKLIIITIFLMLTSCVSSSAGITTSNIPLEGKEYRVLGPAEVTLNWTSFDIGIIGIPLGRPPVSEAEEILLQKYSGDALINLRYWTDKTIIFFVTRHRFNLKADVVKLGK